MYRFLLTGRWIGIHLACLLLIPVFILLGFWQHARYEDAAVRNDRLAASLRAKPVPVESLTEPGAVVPRDDWWRPVRAVGRYLPDGEVVARHRTDKAGELGFFVLTPLELRDGRVVLVNRGWVEAPGDARAYPEVPAPPSGEVVVTGRLRASETSANSGIRQRSGLPEGQVMRIGSEEAAERLPGREVLGGYVELTDSAPQTDPSPTPASEPEDSNTGLHLAYTFQWWLFAAAVPFGWWKLVRRERLERDKAETGDGAGAEERVPVKA